MHYSSLQYEKLDKIKYPLANKFYKEVYKKGIVNSNEEVFILKNIECKGEIICSLKIKKINLELLLTGVACLPSMRNKGLASYLIKKTLGEIDSSVYCFAYKELADLYIRLGFTTQKLIDIPKEILFQFEIYNKKNNLLLMYYNKNASILKLCNKCR